MILFSQNWATYLDSVGRQAENLQKVSVHIFIDKTNTKLNVLYIGGSAIKS